MNVRPATLETLYDFFREFNVGWFDDEGRWHAPEGDPSPHRNGSTNGHAQVRETLRVAGDEAEIARRARGYIARMPKAISGQNGSGDAIRVAAVLVRGYDMSIDEALPLFREYSDTCSPPWSEKESLHKLESADKHPGERGYLLKNYRGQQGRFTYREPGEEGQPPIKEETFAPFPIECFPEMLSRFASEVAISVGCPIDFPAVTMLAVAGTALGASRALAVRRKWLEYGRFYLAIVADPGAAKTPAVNAVCQPLYKRQASLATQWEEEVKEYEYQREIYEQAKKKAANKDRPSDSVPTKPARPPFPHLYTTDATTESLAPILAQNKRGIVLVRDEVTAWVLGMNQYKGGKGSDRQFWLSAWSGEPVKVDRKTNQEAGPVQVPHPFINVLGGIQPDMLSSLCDERNREDGFIHRILFAYPPMSYGLDWVEMEISDEAEAAWNDAIGWMLDLEMHQNQDGTQRPRIVSMTPEARAVWMEWWNLHAEEMRNDEFSYAMVGVWSKLRSYMARIALVVHFLRLACQEEVSGENVDQASMARAAMIMDYFKSHLRRVYGRLKAKPEDVAIEQVMNWIQRHGGECTARDMVRGNQTKRTSEAVKLMEDLVDRQRGKLEQRKNAQGRVYQVFVAN